MARKKFKDLDLTDAFLFAAAMEDPETCQTILELILGRSIGPVNVQVERSMLFISDYRYVRFDVFASDTTKVSYNLEMQNGHKSELPKRSRYHQAEMDAMSLASGMSFKDLQDSMIVFICTFDPFHSRRYRYTYEEICKETGEPLLDGTCKIFLNTKGTNESEVPKELVDFLHYVEDSSEGCAEASHNEQIMFIAKKLVSLKKSRKLEEKYMTMQEMLEDQKAEGLEEGIEKGIEQGIEQGSTRMLNLVTCMLKNGHAEEIIRLSTDKDFYHDMLEKYHIN